MPARHLSIGVGEIEAPLRHPATRSFARRRGSFLSILLAKSPDWQRARRPAGFALGILETVD